MKYSLSIQKLIHETQNRTMSKLSFLKVNWNTLARKNYKENRKPAWYR